MAGERISYDEAREFLSARTTISSNLGPMLDRMREGRSGHGHQGSARGVVGGDIKRSQEFDELKILRRAAIIRCIDALANRAQCRWRSAYAPDLIKFAQKAKLGDGEVILRVLYAYEPWGSQWPEKGLVEAYQWMRTALPKLREIEADGIEPAQAFRLGKSPDARKIAAAIVADAHVLLHHWTGAVWNNPRANCQREPKEAA